MLKNTTKILTILALIILTFMVPLAYADEPQTTTNQENIPTEMLEIQKKDLFLRGENIKIENPIDGNVFIIGKEVTISNQIGGNAFILAEKINLEENAYIFSSLFANAKEINSKGVIFDVYANAQKIDLNGYVYRDIHINAKDLNISGVVGRNAYVSVLNLTFNIQADQKDEQEINMAAMINGNLNYSAPKNLNITKKEVSGEINYIENNKIGNLENKTTYHILAIGTTLALISILWLVYKWQTPNFLKETEKMISTPKNIIKTIINGILSPIIIIILATILLVIPITTAAGLILLVGFMFLLLLSISTFIIAINEAISNKFKFETSLIKYASLLILGVIYYLIALIPYIGIIFVIITGILGLGLLTNRFYNINKPKKTEKEKLANKEAKKQKLADKKAKKEANKKAKANKKETNESKKTK